MISIAYEGKLGIGLGNLLRDQKIVRKSLWRQNIFWIHKLPYHEKSRPKWDKRGLLKIKLDSKIVSSNILGICSFGIFVAADSDVWVG